MISLIWIWPIVSLSPTNNVTKVNTDLRNVLTGISLCYPHTHSLPDLVIVIGNVAVLLNFIPNQMFSWKGKFVSKLCNIRWPWAPTELSVLCVLYCNLDLNWSFKHNENVARIKNIPNSVSKSTSVGHMVLCEHERHIGCSVTGDKLQSVSSSSPYVHM